MREERILSIDELRQVWHRLDSANALTGLAVKLSIVTWQSSSVIVRARWSDFNDRWIWVIPPSGRRVNSSLVFIPPIARDLLNDLSARTGREGFLFPSRHYRNACPISSGNLTEMVRRISRKVNFESGPFSFRDLRATCAALAPYHAEIRRAVVNSILKGCTDKRQRRDVVEAFTLWGEFLEREVVGSGL